MIALSELDMLAAARLEDARALLAAGRFDGAVYVGGYCIELTLKARICRTLGWPDFPATTNEFRDYTSFRTHTLSVLLRLSGIEARIKISVPQLWAAVSQWNPEFRYRVIGSTTATEARDFVTAAAAILPVL